ncbi:MAG TPA: TlpA disulfide reductase family protein [Thermodesulfovibrionales bacterium]|nr:TlpA disulfide reductase family protein [Thermodesulfovibrionales bacterium]
MRRFPSRASSAVICLLALALFVLSCTREKERVLEEGKAPGFTLTDLQGTKVSLSGFRGKVVLLEFWATWCPPCRESIPELNRLYDKYRDKGLTVIGISMDKGGDVSSTVGSFMKEQGVVYPVLIDDGKVSALYGVTSIPAMFIVDKEGKMVKKFVGFIPGLAENLSREIEALL